MIFTPLETCPLSLVRRNEMLKPPLVIRVNCRRPSTRMESGISGIVWKRFRRIWALT